MAVTQNSFTGNGSTTTYSFTFPYLKQDEIKASLDGTATTAFTTPTATTVQFNTAPASGVKIKIFRETDTDSLAATFYAGSAIKSEDLNDNFTQNLYAVQEVTARYLSNLGGTMLGDLNLAEDVVIKFEGATDNAHETTLTVADPTADRTITLPNVTGTVVTTGDTGTVATGMIAADAIDGTKIADDTINSEHYAAASIDTEHIADAQVTTAKLAADAVTTAKITDANVTTAKIADANITTAKIAADAITGAKIADDQIDSEHYAAGSIDTEHIADSQITSAKIANGTIVADDLASNAVTTAKITDANVTTAKIADSNVTTAKLADNAVTTAKVTDANITTAKLADNAVTTAKITDANVTTAKIADANVTTAKIADDNVTTAKIPDNAITTDKIADAELTTLAGMQSGTASILADSTALTATTAELNILDDKSFRASGDGALTTTSDTEIPSSKVIASHVASSITAVGGFKSIADEVSFPATASMPATGVAVSINNAAGVVVNGSGVSTTGRTTDGTPATVTINGFPSSLYGETLAAGVGLIVQATSTANTYTYHKLLAAETDVKQLSDDINDFNARYRVAGSAPGSNNDAGDLYFDTAANKMKVYNGTTSAWDDVASVGNFYINTISSSSNTGGGSATFNGSAYRFTLSNPPTMAQQLIVSVNGVLQKPDAGTGQPSEGFAINGNDIIFSAAPASGSDYFIVTQGSSVSIGTPSDNTVSTAKIQNLAVTNAKIANDTIAEGKLDVHNAPATGKYLKYTSNGMEWSDGASEGTDVKSTGESGTTKFLRTDGDGTSSWQTIPSDSSKANLSGAAFTGEVDIADGEYLDFGNGGLKIRSNANNAYILEESTGKLQIQASNLEISNAAANKTYLYATDGGSIDLYHNNAKKLETTSSGINVTGAINVNGAALSTAPEVKLTASEAITAEDPIMVKTNGQAEKITGVNSGMSTELNLGSTGRQGANIAFDKNTDRWVAVYYDNSNSRYLYGRVGTKNGNNISWGASCALESCAGDTDEVYSQIGLEYSPNRQKLIYAYRGCSGSQARVGVLTVDTTNNTVSKAYGGNWNNNTKSPRFAMGGGVECYAWWDGSNQNKGKITRLSYGTNSVSDQSTITIDSNHQNSSNPDIAFGNGIFLVVFNGNTGHPFARTVGTNFTMGVISTELASWDLPSENGPKVTYDSDNSVFVICYPIHNSHFYGQVITANSGAITYGTPFIISDNYDCRKAQSYDVSYNATAKKLIFTYVSQNGGGKYRTAVVSGSGTSATCTMDTETDLFGTNTSRESEYVHVANNDEDNVFGIITNTNSGYTAYTRVYTPSNTNMEPNRFVGFAKSSVSSGAEVTVKVNSNTSTQSGLTAGSVYYLQGDGSLGTSPSGDGTLKAGLALSSTKLLIKD